MVYAISETGAYKMSAIIGRLSSWPDCDLSKNFPLNKQIVSLILDHVYKIFSKILPRFLFLGFIAQLVGLACRCSEQSRLCRS